MGCMSSSFKLFYRNVQPKLGRGSYVLLHAFRENKCIALRVHVQAWRCSGTYGWQNVRLEEGLPQLSKERPPASEAVVYVYRHIETYEKGKDEHTKDGIRRGNCAEGGFETLVIRHGVQNKSRRCSAW